MSQFLSFNDAPKRLSLRERMLLKEKQNNSIITNQEINISKTITTSQEINISKTITTSEEASTTVETKVERSINIDRISDKQIEIKRLAEASSTKITSQNGIEKVSDKENIRQSVSESRFARNIGEDNSMKQNSLKTVEIKTKEIKDNNDKDATSYRRTRRQNKEDETSEPVKPEVSSSTPTSRRLNKEKDDKAESSTVELNINSSLSSKREKEDSAISEINNERNKKSNNTTEKSEKTVSSVPEEKSVEISKSTTESTQINIESMLTSPDGPLKSESIDITVETKTEETPLRSNRFSSVNNDNKKTVENKRDNLRSKFETNNNNNDNETKFDRSRPVSVAFKNKFNSEKVTLPKRPASTIIESKPYRKNETSESLNKKIEEGTVKVVEEIEETIISPESESEQHSSNVCISDNTDEEKKLVDDKKKKIPDSKTDNNIKVNLRSNRFEKKANPTRPASVNDFRSKFEVKTDNKDANNRRSLIVGNVGSKFNQNKNENKSQVKENRFSKISEENNDKSQKHILKKEPDIVSKKSEDSADDVSASTFESKTKTENVNGTEITITETKVTETKSSNGYTSTRKTIETSIETTADKGPLKSNINSRDKLKSANKPLSVEERMKARKQQVAPKVKVQLKGKNMFKEADANVVRVKVNPMQMKANTNIEKLLKWIAKRINEYPCVEVTNFTSSWSDGIALCALMHYLLGEEAIKPTEVSGTDKRKNFEMAVKAATDAGVPALLNATDLSEHEIDRRSMITYLHTIYKVLVADKQEAKK